MKQKKVEITAKLQFQIPVDQLSGVAAIKYAQNHVKHCLECPSGQNCIRLDILEISPPDVIEI